MKPKERILWIVKLERKVTIAPLNKIKDSTVYNVLGRWKKYQMIV